MSAAQGLLLVLLSGAGTAVGEGVASTTASLTTTGKRASTTTTALRGSAERDDLVSESVPDSERHVACADSGSNAANCSHGNEPGEQTPVSSGSITSVPVCGNYMGPDYCNGKDGQHESTCFPLKKTQHPFSDRKKPRDCGDVCAQKHDYCCHNRVGECDDCIMSDWGEDCNTGLLECLKACKSNHAVDRISDENAAFGRCGECALDAVIDLYKGASSRHNSCMKGLLNVHHAFPGLNFLINIGDCRKKDNPWSLRFANFHNHPVKIVVGSGQSHCAKGKYHFWDTSKSRYNTDHLVLQPGETMKERDSSQNARMPDILWWNEKCTFTVRNANNDGALVDITLWYSLVDVEPQTGTTIGHLRCQSSTKHHRNDQNVGSYLDVGDGDGGDGEHNNPGCTVCLCSNEHECSKHCSDRKQPHGSF